MSGLKSSPVQLNELLGYATSCIVVKKWGIRFNPDPAINCGDHNQTLNSLDRFKCRVCSKFKKKKSFFLNQGRAVMSFEAITINPFDITLGIGTQGVTLTSLHSGSTAT